MRILIVEDELKLSSFLKESLEAEFFAVDIADTGEIGSQLARINERWSRSM
jgi:DNA-binding response OmpR family regulator